MNVSSRSPRDEPAALAYDIMVTIRQISASAPAPSVPPIGNKMASDSNDVSMIEASGEESGAFPSTTDIQPPKLTSF